MRAFQLIDHILASHRPDRRVRQDEATDSAATRGPVRWAGAGSPGDSLLPLTGCRGRQPMTSLSNSPFPPIAEYAFLSNCHTGALVAPDGSVDWLCVPRFDSPSCLGNLLDRGAGYFRFGPYGINVPTHRAYEPGTTVLVTTWHTPGGWVEIRDALTMAPRSGPVEVELVCEPALDYGRVPANWTIDGPDAHTADAAGAGQTLRLRSDLALGREGSAIRGRHVLREGERVFCALSWSTSLDGPADEADATHRLEVTGRFWRRWLARARVP